MKTFRVSLVILSLLFASNTLATSLILSRVALGPNDKIDWAQFNGFNPTTVTSNLGYIATVSNPSGNLASYVQGSSWYGNFAPGDTVILATLLGNPSLFISFNTLVSGAGAQIQDVEYGTFTGVGFHNR